VCAGEVCSMCCDTCCSTCSSTQPSVDDFANTKRQASKSTSALRGASGPGVSAAGGNTPSSPFKIFRSSEPRSDTEDSLEDSSNTLSRTPPYAGVDVEEVEMTSTEDDKDADTVVLQSHQPDTKPEIQVNTPKLKTASTINVANDEEPTLLISAATNTLDTLFGEVSDSDSEPPCRVPATVKPAAGENASAVSANNDQPSVAIKLPARDIEDGEITDSDTESVKDLPGNVPSVADKENAVVNRRTGRPVDGRLTGSSPQKTNVKPQGRYDSVNVSHSTSHSSPRRRMSSDKERNPSSGTKSRLGSGDDRNRSPQFARNRSSDDRKERPAGREDVSVQRDVAGTKSRSSGTSSERRPTSRARGSDRRQPSPRKRVVRSRSVCRDSAKFFRGRRTAIRPTRRF